MARKRRVTKASHIKKVSHKRRGRKASKKTMVKA